MGRVFVAHSEAVEYSDFGGKKFADALTAAKHHVTDLTWQELALYNWGTQEPAEVNRALIELIGCGKIDTADPTKSEFVPAAGPGGSPKILLPKLWNTANLAADKTHTVTVARRDPPPAVTITGLSRWFMPETEACRLDYVLEGVTSRASKVDFEVYPSRYFDLVKKGQELVEEPFPPTDEIRTAPIFHKRLLEVTTPRPPSDAQAFAGWKGESEAVKGVLKKQGSQSAYITYACAPYTALVRYYKDDGDNKATIRPAPFLPRWKSPTDVVDETLVVTWEIDRDNDKLVAGQLLILDKDDNCVFRAALSKQRLRTQKKYDLVNDAAHKWDKNAIRADAMPYRVQLQAHSSATEPNGLAIATMNTEVKPLVYRDAQFVGFNIKPGTRQAPPGYLGEADDRADITKRCDVLKAAIRAARPKVDSRESVLKIFMGPEFYFRGSAGAYQAEHISAIMAEMREETDRFEYADWLFVFGTAIGYIPHGGAETAAKELTEVSHHVEITGTSGDTVSKIKVKIGSALANYMVDSLALNIPWTLSQQTEGQTPVTEKLALAHYDKSDGSALLTLASKVTALKSGPALVTEPAGWVLKSRTGTGGATEIQVKSPFCSRVPYTIIAATTARWAAEQGTTKDEVTACAPDSSGSDIYWLTLKSAAAFAVGPVKLFEPETTEILNVALVQKGWPAPMPDDTGLRTATVYKEYVSPIDFLRTSPLDFHATDGSGRVIEVHGDSNRRVVPVAGSRDLLAADPNVPSSTSPRTWTDKQGTHVVGSEINLSGIGGGSVFTIDGITFGLEVCLDHAMDRLWSFYSSTPKAAHPGDPKVQIHLIPSWGMSIGQGSHGSVKNGLVFNVDGARGDSVARVNDDAFSCDRHPNQIGTSAKHCPLCAAQFVCPGCGSWWVSVGVLCPGCGRLGIPADVPVYQRIGTPIPSIEEPVNVAAVLPKWSDYFQATGPVVIAEVRAIPKPEAVS